MIFSLADFTSFAEANFTPLRLCCYEHGVCVNAPYHYIPFGDDTSDGLPTDGDFNHYLDAETCLEATPEDSRLIAPDVYRPRNLL